MKNRKTKKLLAYKKGGGIGYSTLGQSQREVEQRDTIRRLREELKTVQKDAETERKRRELQEKKRTRRAAAAAVAMTVAKAAEREAYSLRQELGEVQRLRQEELRSEQMKVRQARRYAERLAYAITTLRAKVAQQSEQPNLVLPKPELIIKDYDTVNIQAEERQDIPSDILRELQDPITSNIMTDPVITTSGRTFDRTSINDYITRLRSEGHKPSDPFSGGIEIDPNILIPNLAVRSLIEYYFATTTGGTRKQKKSRKQKNKDVKRIT